MRDQFISLIKNWAEKLLIKKIFGAAVGGIKGFIFNYVFKKFWQEMAYPLITKAFRKVTIFFNRKKYYKKADKLTESKTEEQFDDSFDNLP